MYLTLKSEFSDVNIVVGQDGEVFPAHKLIMAARSEYFRKMFYNAGMKEATTGECRFEHDDPSVFKTMLYHLYARPLDVPPEPRHLVMCLISAEKFGIGNNYFFILFAVYLYFLDTFRDFCLKSLEEAISSTTACEILALLEELYEDERIVVSGTLSKCFEYP